MYSNSPASRRRISELSSLKGREFLRGSEEGRPCWKQPGEPQDEDDYIGFATLPDQVHRKAVKKGFDFTLMVVGESGLGKSTLINSLFLTDLYPDKYQPPVEEKIYRTVEIDKKQLEIEEKGVRLRLSIVDTPGFNDALNAETSWKTIVDYIDRQFEQYLQDESGLNRKNIVDNRVHCLLYFISPLGHGLKPLDILVMTKLHNKVNIVPVLAKADTLTKDEIKKMKENIMNDISRNDIQIYKFPECDSDEDEEFKMQDAELKACLPFAVVGCNAVVEVAGRKIRGRAYPWGIVEVDNPKHCDFNRLRQMLISTHMQDLKDMTSDVHYENFRAERLQCQLQSQILLGQKERSKLKRDSSPNFEAIMNTEKLLKDKDEEIRRMQAMLDRMQQELDGGKDCTGLSESGRESGKDSTREDKVSGSEV